MATFRLVPVQNIVPEDGIRAEIVIQHNRIIKYLNASIVMNIIKHRRIAITTMFGIMSIKVRHVIGVILKVKRNKK